MTAGRGNTGVWNDVDRVAAVTLVSAVITLGIATVAVAIGGNPAPFTHPNEAGFDSALLWFELARSPDEVFLILGPSESEQGSALRTALDRINTVDFVFMLAYPLLMTSAVLLLRALLVQRGVSALVGRKVVVLCVAVAVGTAVADVGETVQLLALTKASSARDIAGDQLATLWLCTSLKWTALFGAAAAAAIASTIYFRRHPAVITAAPYAFASVAGLASLYVPGSRSWLEPAMNALAVGWLVSAGHAAALLYRARRARRAD